MLTRYRLDIAGLNTALLAGFHANEDNPDIRRTHLFDGRYENIYLTSKEVPALEQLLDLILDRATELLGTDRLRYGLWFNDMPPGATTTLHNHDNEDELLSCVYYVNVPADSGDFIIYWDDVAEKVTPTAGDLFFFDPQRDHEVTINNSDENRLSIAINFGPPLED